MHPTQQSVVWLKRDVRLHDHEPLAIATSHPEPVLILYVYEPSQMQSDTYHEAHHTFVNEGLRELDTAVCVSSTPHGITFRVGEVVDVLSDLHARLPIARLLSHREVGNAISRERNSRVADWAASQGIEWTQCRQDGVSDVRHEHLDEGTWAKKWTGMMSSARWPAPTSLHLVGSALIESGTLQLDARACGVAHLGARPGAQRGGESRALESLRSFLQSRGENYSEELSSPLTGWDSCSRLSPYLAWGHVSLRHVYQELSARQENVRRAKKGGIEMGGWLKSLAAHGARLRWRSHFSQKLHDEPSIEHANMVTTYDGLRTAFDQAKYDAFVAGQTGFPMVDACMRSLTASGWLNFRMRCMLVSFASYDLWLDWRRLTPVMARLFLDYEPGIHYPQFQMQSGTTGINANRIYSPSKQARAARDSNGSHRAEDHAGPDYAFIRQWVPELRHVPGQYVAQPETMPLEVQQQSGCLIGSDYPQPIVDHSVAYRHALSEFARVRAQAETKEQAAAVYEKHGSRKRPHLGPTRGGDGGGDVKRQAGASQAAASSAVAGSSEALVPSSQAIHGNSPFAMETAASGRAACRQCGAPIAKGGLKVCVSAWARGGRISANHHHGCFLRSLRIELIVANRGKCKHSGRPFVKGGLRVGFATTGADELNWLSLDAAVALLPALAVRAETAWAPSSLIGFATLPPEQRAALEAAFAV